MSCQPEPIPLGWHVWRQTEVPTPLVQAAIDVRDHVNKYKRGTIARTMVYNGQTIGIWVSSHTWTWRNGVLVTGLCIPGASILVQQPTGSVGASTPDSLVTPDPTAAVYSAEQPPGPDWPLVGISAGAGATVVTLFLLALKHAGKAARRR